MGKLKKQLTTKGKGEFESGIKSKNIKKSLADKKSLKEKIRSRIGLLKKKSPSKFEKSLKPSLKSSKNESPFKETLQKKSPNKKNLNNESPVTKTLNKELPVTRSLKKELSSKLTNKSVKSANVSLVKAALEEKYKVKADTVISAFKGVLKLLELHLKKMNELFDDEQPIFLQITCIKIPVCPERILRIPLKHSLLTDSSEICLIVPDIRGIPIKEYDRVVDHYEQLLHSKDIRNIKTIMPFHQLKYEYGQFELKRRLVELYDVFLVDGKISGYVVRQLGKIFYNKRKLPVPIKLQASNLKVNIETALQKTPLPLHGKGDTYIMQVGHSKMDVEQVVENVYGVLEILEKQFPGGLDNIRALYLKGAQTESVPIYYTLKSKNVVEVPLVQSKRPKHYVPVSGELSTKNRSEVVVLPTGEVFVNPITNENDDLNELNDEFEDFDDDDVDEDNISLQQIADTEPKKVKRKKQNETVSEDDTNQADETYTKEELAYLLEIEDEEVEISGGNKEEKQIKRKLDARKSKQKPQQSDKKAKLSGNKFGGKQIKKAKGNKINSKNANESNDKKLKSKKKKTNLLSRAGGKIISPKNPTKAFKKGKSS